MKDLLQKLTDLENTLDSMDPTPKEVKQEMVNSLDEFLDDDELK